MKISTCLSTNPAVFDAVPFKGNLEENVKDIAAMGFDGIELAVRDPRIIDQEGVIDTIKAAGLEIPAIGTGQAWGEEGLSFTDPDAGIRKKAVERIISHLEFARKAEAVVIIGLVRGTVQPGVSEEDALRWMFEAFSECCAEAAGAGVRIAFEPINRYETSLLNGAEQGLEFINSVGSENLGMLLDTFHMNIEEPSIEESIRMTGDRIFHFHYADSNRLYPRAGHLNFESIMEALYSTGYSGYISGEHRPDPEPRFAVSEGLKYMRSLGRALELTN